MKLRYSTEEAFKSSTQTYQVRFLLVKNEPKKKQVMA